MTRSVNSNIVTSAGTDNQKAWYAVEVGYATPKRVTNKDVPLSISGNVYAPWPLKIESLVSSGSASNDAVFVVGNDPGDSNSFGRLDLSEDSVGMTVKIYEVWITGAGQVEHLVFQGEVSKVDGDDLAMKFRCRPTFSTNSGSRAGNYVVWSDEFPHTPEPGTTIEIGGQSGAVQPSNPPVTPVYQEQGGSPYPGIPGAYWSLLGLPTPYTPEYYVVYEQMYGEKP